MTEHACVVCPQLRQGDPRVYERAHVCEGCRSRLRSLLVEVVENYAEVGPQPPVNVGRWSGPELDKNREPVEHYDPVAAEVPAGPVLKINGQRVSGTSGSPLPLPISPLDLTMPARVGIVREPPCTCREPRADCRPGYPHRDQCGDISVATVLDSWAVDWQSYRWALLPEPTVGRLATWLRERLDWACDNHPAVDDFAWELNDLARKLRPRAPQVELKKGVPCRDCERFALYRWPGSDYVECLACPCLLTSDEYDRWVALIASPEHVPWVRELVQRQKESVG